MGHDYYFHWRSGRYFYLMKILSAAQIRAWDAATIEKQNINSLTLMERATAACANWLTARYGKDTPFVIVCGTGNNGGDGLAIARLLIGKGYAALAFLIRHTDQLSPDCKANLEALQTVSKGAVRILAEGEFITDLPQEIIVIDALFGTGLNRKPEGYIASFIEDLNRLPNHKIAIDLPSGMTADTLLEEGAVVVRAQVTLSFQQYKRAMLHPESGPACGEVHVIDIGLDAAFNESAESHWHTLDRSFAKNIYRPRQPFSHKGMYGTAFIIGGSYGMMGAALLAAKAAGRAGAGKVRGLIPELGYDIYQVGAPEAMCKTSGKAAIEAITDWEAAEGIGIGPGLGTAERTMTALYEFLERVERPIVLDADALNILGDHKEWLRLIPRHSVLTPHPKELERMFGKTENSFARADMVRQMAMLHELVIVSKDARSIVALPDGRCFYNVYGNAGLATAGSGDVLLGIIAGLLAQSYKPEDAALLGVYLHATAGDIAAGETAMESVVAGDIAQRIGGAFLSLR
jgi:NAD(P)H-hydrate epimerase